MRESPHAPVYGPGRLYWFEEAPPQLQFNRFIRSGYRAGGSPCGLTDFFQVPKIGLHNLEHWGMHDSDLDVDPRKAHLTCWS